MDDTERWRPVSGRQCSVAAGPWALSNAAASTSLRRLASVAAQEKLRRVFPIQSASATYRHTAAAANAAGGDQAEVA